MEEKKTRGANYTVAEKGILLQLVRKYHNLIENKDLNARIVLKKREAWQSICQQYNAVAASGLRSWKQLRHLYENIKQRSKNKNRLQFYEKSREATDVNINATVDKASLGMDDISVAVNSKPCKVTSNPADNVKTKSNIKEQYFKAKLRNANLEYKTIIRKNKMEMNKYRVEMQILKLRLKRLQSSNCRQRNDFI